MKEGTVIPSAAGTSGQVLTSTGAGSAPTFQAAAGGITHFVDTFTYNVSTASGTQAITGTGFLPTLIYFTGVDADAQGASWGATGNGGNVSVSTQLTTGNWEAAVSSRCIQVLTAGGGAGARASLSSFDSDGFTLSWTKIGSPGSRVVSFTYIAFL